MDEKLKCKYCGWETPRYAKKLVKGEKKEIGWSALREHIQHCRPEISKRLTRDYYKPIPHKKEMKECKEDPHAVLEDAMREMYGDDSEYLDEDMGAK